MPNAPLEPWRSFLRELDASLTGPTELHCLGGFVVTQLYGIGRETSDIDFLYVAPRVAGNDLEALAGAGSGLYRKYRVYLQHVTVATAPAEYASRLVQLFPKAGWTHLSLLALEAHDLALSKLERNAEKDREDVQQLAKAHHIDPGILEKRYLDELRPYLLSKIEWHDKTLELWMDMCWPERPKVKN